MQKEKTIEFWDALHRRETCKEWIVHPSDTVLEAIGKLQDGSFILEIGCGTSCLSRDLYCHYKGAVKVVATDVSAVCIRENQERDLSLMAASRGRFTYQVANTLETNSSFENQNDVILDKGCLDTFLFRSGHQEREHLVETLLDNVHRWLRHGGKYVVVTPRSRVRLLRDYKGFCCVRRNVLSESSSRQVMIADLESDNDKTKSECYIYVCHKDPSYVSGQGAAFRDSFGLSLESDEDTCPGCGETFLGFRGGEDMSGRGSKQWARRWRGHRVHCKGRVS